MSVQTMEEREFLRSVFLSTGDTEVLEMLERSGGLNRRPAATTLRTAIMSAVPLAACVVAAFVYSM